MGRSTRNWKWKVMKKTRLPIITLLMFFAVMLSACGTAEHSEISKQEKTSEEVLEILHSPAETKKEPEQSLEQEPAEKAETLQKPEAYNPAPEEITACADTWEHVDCLPKEEHVYRLILSEDGVAQFVIQNGVGELLGLSGGTWSVDGEILSLTLSQDPAYDTEFPSDWETVGGNYRYELREDGHLALTDLDNPHPLLPNMPGETVLFESSSAAFEREMLESAVCNAVRAWYEAETGKAYPGYVTVEGRDETGLTVHLYEDMGDHTATAGWYTVDPGTMRGTDDVLGAEIDFSPYWE